MYNKILNRLCQTTRAERFRTILDILSRDLNVSYVVEEFGDDDLRGRNITINFQPGNRERPVCVLEAHYDLDPSTEYGANDNTAAVAILMDVAYKFLGQSIPLTILLSDLEEPGNGGFAEGSATYAWTLKQQPEFVLCLDVVGRGDVLCCDAMQGGFHRLEGLLRSCGVHKPLMDIHTPPGSNVGFSKFLPRDVVALLCTLPGEEAHRVWEDEERGRRYHDGVTAISVPETWQVLHTPEDCLSTIDDREWLVDALVAVVKKLVLN